MVHHRVSRISAFRTCKRFGNLTLVSREEDRQELGSHGCFFSSFFMQLQRLRRFSPDGHALCGPALA